MLVAILLLILSQQTVGGMVVQYQLLEEIRQTDLGEELELEEELGQQGVLLELMDMMVALHLLLEDLEVEELVQQ
jgi:hypothetical protein